MNLFYGIGNLLIDAIKWSQEAQNILQKIFLIFSKNSVRKIITLFSN